MAAPRPVHETSAEGPPRTTPLCRAMVLITTMILTATASTLLIEDFYTFNPSDTLGLVALGLLFLVSEKLIFHVEARSEAVSYSPSDIALGIGVALYGPIGVLTARLIGASIGQALFRRPEKVKYLFNVANFILETVVAFGLFQAATSVSPAATLSTWAALISALFVALLVGGFTVAGAISCFEGDLLGRLRTEVVNAPVFHLPGAAVASALGIAILVEPFLGFIVASLVPVVWLIVRSHGKLLHRYADLIDAHEFSREVGGESELQDILSTAAEQIGVNMRGNMVAIRIWDRAGQRTEGFSGDRELATALPRHARDLVGFESVAMVAECLDNDAKLNELRVLLRDEQGSVGCVIVADRLGVNPGFDIDDLRRLTAMTQQLTVAIRKGQLHAQIRYEATHDRLTGLANRGFFESWLDETLSDPSQRGCVLFIDLDRFKEVNDAFGHHAGDTLLQSVAERIRLVSPIDGLASRFGGDEFAVFAPNLGIDEATELARRLTRALEEPFDLEQASIAIAPSIGMVVSPTNGRSATVLLRRADIAMYEAKKRSARYALYRPEMEADDSARLRMLVELRAAIVNDQLDVHFQPQIDMRTGKVIGAEALARWHHPEYGPVSPAEFVQLAEGAGLIDALTDRVLARSLEASAQWQQRGWDLKIAVNISARSLLDRRLIDMVEGYLSATHFDASRLTLEITESTMMTDPVRTHDMLHSLTSLGVTISVDDFGTGYSSLQSLGQLPVSELKIDRSFVMAMETSEHDAIIVRSTIDLAHNLGLRAVAEGVEDDALMATLMDLGCDVAQGFGISRPLSIDHFNRWFLERTGHPGANAAGVCAAPSGRAEPVTAEHTPRNVAGIIVLPEPAISL